MHDNAINKTKKNGDLAEFQNEMKRKITDEEREHLALLGLGFKIPDIAKILNIQTKCSNEIIFNAMKKLGRKDVTLVAWFALSCDILNADILSSCFKKYQDRIEKLGLKLY